VLGCVLNRDCPVPRSRGRMGVEKEADRLFQAKHVEEIRQVLDMFHVWRVERGDGQLVQILVVSFHIMS